MNETLSSQPSPLPAPAATEPAKLERRRQQRWRTIALFLLLLAGALLAWKLYALDMGLDQVRADFSRRLRDTDVAASEARAVARQAHDSVDLLQQRLGGLDARLADAASQQDALQSMYQELMRARDERFITEVEQAVSIATQQLQLAGNVPAALGALQSAEARLASQNRPQLLAVRKLLARDIERLKSLPTADVTGMALRLETMLGVIDSLPLGFEHKPHDKVQGKAPDKRPESARAANNKTARAAAGAAPTASAPVTNAVPLDEEPGFFAGLMSELGTELRQLVRIERLDRPEPPLLSPQQAQYLRENLRLRLLSARLGLLQRDARSFGEDIRQSRNLLERYFDVSTPPVLNMLNDLRQMEAARLNVELPSLTETEAALRNLKFGRAN